MELSIICVNWNSLSYLHVCIASIYENTSGVEFEIIVVDNASSEDRVESILEHFPAVKVIKSSRNLGFAGANNVGFLQSRGSHVLFLNPDTKLLGPAITIMLKSLKSLPDTGIVGCKLLDADLSISTTSIQKFPTILNQLINFEYLSFRWPSCPLWDLSPLFSRSATPVSVEVIPGACMLLRRDIFAKAGMFSDEYFMYAEDLDLNYKIRSLGFRNYYVGEGEVIHYGGKSSDRQSVNQWATMMKHRAMVRLFKKTRGRLYGAAYRTVMGANAVGRLVVLGVVFPFGYRETVRSSSKKWLAVLRWSLGLHGLLLKTGQ